MEPNVNTIATNIVLQIPISASLFAFVRTSNEPLI